MRYKLKLRKFLKHRKKIPKFDFSNDLINYYKYNIDGSICSSLDEGIIKTYTHVSNTDILCTYQTTRHNEHHLQFSPSGLPNNVYIDGLLVASYEHINGNIKNSKRYVGELELITKYRYYAGEISTSNVYSIGNKLNSQCKYTYENVKYLDYNKIKVIV